MRDTFCSDPVQPTLQISSKLKTIFKPSPYYVSDTKIVRICAASVSNIDGYESTRAVLPGNVATVQLTTGVPITYTSV